MSLILRLIATVGVLAAVIWFVAPEALAESLRDVRPGWLAIAVAALTLQILLSAQRWHLTAQALGIGFSRAWARQEYGLSVASNTFLPGGVMGDLARVVRARHFGWRIAAASVVIERFAGQVALGLVTLASAALWLGAAAGLLLMVATVVICAGLLRLLPGPALLLWRAWGQSRVWPGQVALSLGILALNLFGLWAAARAAGLVLDPAQALALIPLTLFAMVLPLTINGWGLREGVAAALWPLAGIGAAHAVAATVVFGVACMLAALLGLIPWLLARRRSSAAMPMPDDATR